MFQVAWGIRAGGLRPGLSSTLSSRVHKVLPPASLGQKKKTQHSSGEKTNPRVSPHVIVQTKKNKKTNAPIILLLNILVVDPTRLFQIIIDSSYLYRPGIASSMLEVL